MTKTQEKRRLVGSIMDRLDGDPSRTDPRFAGGQRLSELKLSVCRDLENLLNTRRRCLESSPECRELGETLIDYGIPDFTGLNMSVPAMREELRLEIERVIRRFEPRLTTVTVTVQSNADRFDRTLRLRITGVLRAKPVPESVMFDSELRPSTATIEVKAVP
jgi:type VI secretion system protein ImpF